MWGIKYICEDGARECHFVQSVISGDSGFPRMGIAGYNTWDEARAAVMELEQDDNLSAEGFEIVPIVHVKRGKG